jgi:hypothetical protein
MENLTATPKDCDFKIVHDEIFMDEDKNEKDPCVLFCSQSKEKIKYITISKRGIIRKWKATKRPEHLSKEERDRVLRYRFGGDFYDDEPVNCVDLFMQSEFIKEKK